jgi:hypothetical protein
MNWVVTMLLRRFDGKSASYSVGQRSGLPRAAVRGDPRSPGSRCRTSQTNAGVFLQLAFPIQCARQASGTGGRSGLELSRRTSNPSLCRRRRWRPGKKFSGAETRRPLGHLAHPERCRRRPRRKKGRYRAPRAVSRYCERVSRLARLQVRKRISVAGDGGRINALSQIRAAGGD